MRGIRISLFLLLTLGLCKAMGQSQVVLTEQAFLQGVLENHPLAKRADLLPESGAQLVRAARGAFDPRLGGTYDQKEYTGKSYYEILEVGLQVPTWYGIKAVAGYLHNEGQYLNPEDFTAPSGLAAIGLEWTPLRGLVIDKRRAALQKAQLYAQANEAERKALLNELIADAATAYWEWLRSWYSLAIYEEGVALAQVRLDAVRAGWRGGARPAIDTTEARLQVQARMIEASAAAFKYNKARFQLESFLWSGTGEPLELRASIAPTPLAEIPAAPIPLVLETAFDSLLDSHPEIMAYALKIEQLEVERRLQAEQLKPDLNLKWQFLGAPPGAQASPGYEFGIDNYKLAVGLNFPLFLREARGNLALARLQVDAAELGLADKRRALLVKVRGLQAAHDAVRLQSALMAEMVAGNQVLKGGEDRRFEIGESSLFLVNTREQALIKARLEQVGLLSSLPVLRVEYFRALGGAYLLGF